jgi:hypothetical protein
MRDIVCCANLYLCCCLRRSLLPAAKSTIHRHATPPPPRRHRPTPTYDAYCSRFAAFDDPYSSSKRRQAPPRARSRSAAVAFQVPSPALTHPV